MFLKGLRVKDRFREIRVVKRIKQENLEAKTHISQSRISLIENGHVNATKKEMEKLAKALGVRVGDIWPKPVRGDSLLTKGIS